jgi:hypothetical protein
VLLSDHEAICCNCFFTIKASINFLITVLSSSVKSSTALNCCSSSASLREALTFSSLSPLIKKSMVVPRVSASLFMMLAGGCTLANLRIY